MLRRRQINAKPQKRGVRAALSTPVDRLRWPFERLVWALEQRLLWPLQERLVWPLRDRADGFALPRPGTAGVLAAIAICALAAAAVALEGDDADLAPLPSADPVAAVAPSPAPVPEPKEEPTGPVLQGVDPEFGVDAGVGVDSGGDPAAAAELNAGADDAGTVDPTEEEAGATTSSEEPVPAGPAAMKVARRFSEAFVFYEIGQRPGRAMTVFGETATPELATALAERPPRQPAGTEVPKAKVLNLVPGPRSGKVYTVSASLLRVGTVSELRLKLTKQAGAWVVTDVRG